MNTQKQIFLIVVAMFVLVGGCTAYSMIELSYRAPLQADWTKSQSVERGALLFANNCRTCHGIKGQGGVGPQLNKPAFQDQDPLVLKANRALLKTTLSCGRAGTLMPAWLNTNGGALNAIQIEHIIDLITAPVDQKRLDEEGNPTSQGWLEAVHFAENLNHETAALVGGDTLDSIAKAHGAGIKEILDLNPGIPAKGFLKQGIALQMPKGYKYTVYNDNETVAKIVESQHAGAIVIADLNQLPYKFSHSKGKATIQLLSNNAVVPGLFPGDKLALPEGVTYVVTAGDMLDAVAQQHGVTAESIRSLNPDFFKGVDTTKPLEHERRLKLPSGAVALAQEGQTLAQVAAMHGLAANDLASANGLGKDVVLVAGDKLSLPAGARYIIQNGDTIEAVARVHGVDAAALAKENNLQPEAALETSVILALPKVDQYTVKGDSLEAVAKTLSNVTAESLGKANGVPADAILRIGQSLKLPVDAWGSAPPDTKNSGTACVQHAVPASVFQTLPGVGSATPAAAAVVTAPAAASKDVKIEANANDFTITADGTKQPANKGAVLIAKGSSIAFAGAGGLHTVTLNGKKDGDDLKQGQSRSITFNEAGQFKLTCDYHPDMKGDIFVQ